MENIVITGTPLNINNKLKTIHKVLRPGYKLYTGSICNDGRPITESWRYKQAIKQGNTIIHQAHTDMDIEHESKETKETKETKEMLVDKYKPTYINEIIGHKEQINQLATWLDSWNNKIPEVRGILITGPPGIGKTTTAHLVAKSLGYVVTEYNASDTRSISILRGMFALGMKRLQKEIIIMDEVDGLSGGKERGGIVEIANIIRKSLVPIICIANQKPLKLKPLINACITIGFSRPMRSTIATALLKITKTEGISINKIELEDLCEKSGNDIRAIMNRLSFYGSNTSEANADKDSVHRLDLFSAAGRLISNKKLSMDAAADLVFVDYNMIPLMIQEAYIASSKNSFDDIEYASELISSGDLITKRLWQTQDWSLLPHIVQTTVSVARSVAGPPPFQIFPQLLGKNSKKAKHRRLLEDLSKRINGGSSNSMRLDYAGPMRRVVTSRLLGDKPDIKGTIETMDILGLTRDDLMETLENIVMDPIDISTKTKTAFTKEWNKKHSGSSSKKRKAITPSDDDIEDNDDDISDLEDEMTNLHLD